jgi:hypothetical protein
VRKSRAGFPFFRVNTNLQLICRLHTSMERREDVSRHPDCREFPQSHWGSLRMSCLLHGY